jgi:GntR family transcriptional regulator
MSEPMYRQIAEDLRGQIESGQLQPGQQLRTETELRDHYGASRNTVRDAIKWLTTLGLVETKPGQGTFVRKQLDPLVNTIGPYPAGEVTGHMAEVAPHRQASFSPTQVEIQEADNLLATELLLPVGSEIISRHQQLYVDGAPWSLQTTFYPHDLADRGAERLRSAREIETGTLSYLHDTLQIRMETWRARLTARSARAIEAEFFRLPPGSAVVEICQTYYEPSGTPFCLTMTVYPPDRNLFQVAAGSVPLLGELPPIDAAALG